MAKRETKKRTRTKAGVPGSSGVQVDPFSDNGKGHNGDPPALSEDERRALFSQHLKKYKAAKTELDAANGRLRALCKLAKAECGADVVKRIRRAIEMSTPEGEARLREEIAATLEVARWLGSPVGTQFTFELEPDRTPAVDRAREDGKRAGLAGEQRKPPHAPGTAQEQAWLEGFNVGNATLAKGIRQKPTETLKATIQAGEELAHRGPAGSL